MENEAQVQATELVRQIQAFDPASLIRKQDLGEGFAFTDAVQPASKLISLYSQMPLEGISELPDQQANLILQFAQGCVNKFQEIRTFDPTAVDSPAAKRDGLIGELTALYSSTFDNLCLLLAYLGSRQRDFGTVEAQARSALDAARQTSTELAGELGTKLEEANGILLAMRQSASEQGVSQQAIYFSTEASSHENQATTWERRTAWAAVIVVGFGVLSIVLHKIPWFKPDNTYDTVQLAVSKIIIFAVLLYGLTLCAKNYIAHKHNGVVNKHRQNALTTYNALVEASSEGVNRDIILTHAASCIFAPQDTGYQHSALRGSDAPPTLQLLPKIGGASEHVQ